MPWMSGILIGKKVVVSDTELVAEILWIGSGMNCAHGNDEAQAVSRSDLAAAAAVHQWNAVLRSDQTGVGFSQGFVPDKVLVDPGQPGSAERGKIASNERFKSDVASFG